LLVGLALIALPFVFNRGERSARRRPWAVAAVLMTVVMFVTLWIAGANSPWSPDFNAKPLSPSVVGATSGPVFVGAQLFQAKGCLNCHLIGGDGGKRGPDLSNVAGRLSKDQMTLKIANGGVNMPAYAANLTPAEMDALIAFLQSRKSQRP
jgi:ubiquinol-cytochrome c reductase cytochrome b subunit